MTEAVIYKRKGEYLGYSIKGHSGYAEAGEDVVCSAVSILGINTANAIIEYTSDGDRTQIISNEEDALLSLRISDKAGCDSQLLIRTLELGIHSIIEQYGNDYISLKIEEV